MAGSKRAKYSLHVRLSRMISLDVLRAPKKELDSSITNSAR